MAVAKGGSRIATSPKARASARSAVLVGSFQGVDEAIRFPSRTTKELTLAHKIAFVLSGGGPLGAVQVGAMRALFERGVRPDLLVGSSVGALNATYIALHPSLEGVNALNEVWNGLEWKRIFRGSPLRVIYRALRSSDRIYDSGGIRRLITSSIGDAGFDDLEVELGVVATDLNLGEEEVFTSGDLTTALLASTAMPGVLPPVTIGDRSFIDGGVVNNIPILPAVAMGATVIYALDASACGCQARPLKRPLDYWLHASAISRGHRVLTNHCRTLPGVTLITPPPPRLERHVPLASLEHTRILVELGYRQTQEMLDGTHTVATGADDVLAPLPVQPAIAGSGIGQGGAV